ncbi:MAG: class I tRNA ligase family protein, partial [Coprobacillus sp.]|nr:class I tRNA ligase family protein [Coprobacillus sp.]
FSSALWPFATLNWPDTNDPLYKRYFPTSLLCTGYDIIFFWVSRMTFQSLHQTGKPPFKTVIIHGLVRDEKGRKMSKSLGNGVDPLEVIDKYGADALRYFLTTNSKAGLDMRYYDSKVAASANYLNKIYNSARYVLSVLPSDFKPVDDISKLKLPSTHQWIVNKTERCIKKVTSFMEHYNFIGASTTLYDFVYDDFCSSFIEMSKIYLNNDKYDKEVTYQVLYFTLKNIILMISPFTPFISEDIYLNLPEHLESINLETYPTYHSKYIKPEVDKEVEDLVKNISFTREFRGENNISQSEKIKMSLSVNTSKDLEDILYLYKELTNTEEVPLKKESATINNTETFNIYLYKAKLTKEEIEKEVEKVKFEIDRATKLLSNPGFISKAPKEKIEEEESKLATHKEHLKILEDQLK